MFWLHRMEANCPWLQYIDPLRLWNSYTAAPFCGDDPLSSEAYRADFEHYCLSWGGDRKTQSRCSKHQPITLCPNLNLAHADPCNIWPWIVQVYHSYSSHGRSSPCCCDVVWTTREAVEGLGITETSDSCLICYFGYYLCSASLLVICIVHLSIHCSEYF